MGLQAEGTAGAKAEISSALRSSGSYSTLVFLQPTDKTQKMSFLLYQGLGSAPHMFTNNSKDKG